MPQRKRIWQKQGRLALILFVYTLFTIVYSWLIPPFEYADEPRHLAYARWLITYRQFPPQGTAAWETPVMQEAGQPPLYYFFLAVPVSLLEKAAPGSMEQWPLAFRANPTYNGSHTRHYADNDNIALHLPEDMTPLRGERLALVLGRGMTLLFGWVMLIAVYNLTGEMFAKRPFLAGQVTLFTALIPQVLYMSGVISNDIPVAALCTLSFWLLWRVVQKPTLTRGLAAGVAIGLALLTKVSALPLLPIALVAFAWLWQRQQEKRVVWLVTAVTLLSALLIAGWWFGRAWYLYGTPFGLTAHDQAPWAFSETFQRDGLGQQWLDVFESFWASIGWSPTQFHDNVYWLLLGLVLLALVGLGKELWQGWRNPNLVTNLRQNPQPLFLFLFLFMLGATALALEAWMRRVSAPFGRLLFPALAPIIILLWLGWRAIHPYLAHLLLLIVAVLAILAPIHIIWPAYHPQQLPAAAFAQTETLDWQFGDIAQLLRVTPQQSSAQANSTLPVEVCWRTLARAQSDYLVFIHLVGPDNAVIAHRDTIPGLGTYPTTAWQPDTYFCDRIEVRLWDNIPQTLVYNIEVGLIDVGREARLPIYDQAGNPMSNAFAGQVKVAAAAEAAVSLPPRQSTTPAIDVLRVDTPLTWSINTTQAITVAWGVYEDIAVDYQVFAHLIDSQSGELITQSDGAPFAGWYNTSWWSGGTVVVEKRPFPIPDTAPPGTYTLIVGLYNLQTGERLVEKQAAAITLQR